MCGGVEAVCTRRGRRRMKSVWRCGGYVHEKREKEDEECVEVWRLCAQRQIAPRSKIPRV